MESQKCLQGFADGSEAARIGRRLIEIEIRGRGDVEAAMYRLQAETGIDFWTWWAWRYRPPTARVLRSTWDNLIAVYQVKCARLRRTYGEEFEEARALGRSDTDEHCQVCGLPAAAD